jgi:hypothetical protein
MREDSAGPGAIEREAGFDFEPCSESGKILRRIAWSCLRGGRRNGASNGRRRTPPPVARRFANRDIDPGIEPPAKRAYRRGTIRVARRYFHSGHAA